MNTRFAPALAAGLLIAVVNSAQAQTAIGEMSVSAVVTRTCTLSAEALVFDDVHTSEVTHGSAVVTLACNGVSTVTTILVGMGAHADPPTTQRNLGFGEELMPYTLHVPPGGGVDIATDGAVPLEQVGTTDTYTTTLHGEIQPNPLYPMGSYVDTVILTAVYAP